ncbi:type II toxin-antitoxin system VapC family toxin [Aquincola sp. S2]|uniref:Ribonuclease VapC n=1 Tax=Pseudaquabacterium terrae TaxID=2732868 RepID=A0ABX2EJL1_9BURK|nr:type II toxin-antitoxin system VapC family toxin [Aquabacterium terrae]NRF68847.1 type II toxin-antitoxin system VapC family toxin [Aquabacterium terrae]
MIAVDTNVLVRLLVNDDADQAAKARRFFDAQAEREEPVWVADTVLVELGWTLLRAYGRPRADLVVALRALTAHATVALESPEAVSEALALFERGPADFADCLLCAKARLAGCGGVATFDRAMKTLAGVKLL